MAIFTNTKRTNGIESTNIFVTIKKEAQPITFGNSFSPVWAVMVGDEIAYIVSNSHEAKNNEVMSVYNSAVGNLPQWTRDVFGKNWRSAEGQPRGERGGELTRTTLQNLAQAKRQALHKAIEQYVAHTHMQKIINEFHVAGHKKAEIFRGTLIPAGNQIFPQDCDDVAVVKISLCRIGFDFYRNSHRDGMGADTLEQIIAYYGR